jgi:hypothetical protein
VIRTIPALAASFFGFVAMEAAIFHSGLYVSIVSPDSSTGYMETVLNNEAQRSKQGPQIVAIGDSRMGLLARVGNELTPETGYTFASIAVAGSTPRCWYYMLREADPDANRYAAVVVTLDSFDDVDTGEDWTERESDLHYLIARLRLSDLFGFSRSYHSTEGKWRAFEGILLKGLIYKRDFEDFLVHPQARIAAANLSREYSHTWIYDYVPTKNSLAGVTVDWVGHTVTVPPDRTPAQKAEYERLVQPLPPQDGLRGEYLHYWLGKIYEHYRGSHTRLVFFRVPRAPFISPIQPPYNPHSAVRDMAVHPEVVLAPEHLYDVLERPELFMDVMHLNGPGIEQFSHMMARQMREILGPPK